MPYEEKDVYTTLGLEMPAAKDGQGADDNTAGVVTGGQDQNAEGPEVAEPGQQPEGKVNLAKGQREGPLGESANTGLNDVDDPDEGIASEVDAGDGTEPKPAKVPMSKEERARNAAARRKAEMDAAIRQAVQQATAEQAAQHQQQMALFFATANLKDPATGKAITTMEEYNAFLQGQQLRRVEDNLRKGKLSMEDLQAVIANQMTAQPDQGGQKVAARSAAPAEAPARDTHEVTQEQIDRELADISKLDPGVKTLEDILALETGPAFADAVRRGASFIDAFKLANFDRLQQARQEESAKRAQQAALNSQRSKEHLTTSSQKGQGSVAVPAEELALYRKLNPKATDEEISAHYNKTVKKLK